MSKKYAPYYYIPCGTHLTQDKLHLELHVSPKKNTPAMITILNKKTGSVEVMPVSRKQANLLIADGIFAYGR